MSIEKVECGAVMEGFGNCCFFLSLLEGLKSLNLFSDWTLDEFIQLSKFWTSEKKGKMVDTIIDVDSIQNLALKLGVRIAIYTELSSNKVNIDSVMVYGINHSQTIRIVKVVGRLHYNYMTFTDGNDESIKKFEMEAYLNRMLIKNEEFKTKEAEALQKQAEENNKAIESDLKKHRREMESLKIEKQITNTVIEISKLQDDLNGWLESLTILGRDESVENRIKLLFSKYKEQYDILENFQAELSKMKD